MLGSAAPRRADQLDNLWWGRHRMRPGDWRQVLQTVKAMQLKPVLPLTKTPPIYPATPVGPAHISQLLGQLKLCQMAMRKLLNRALGGHPLPMPVPSFLLRGSSLKHPGSQDEEVKLSR